MMNVSRLVTAHQMWASLSAVHESRGHQYAIALLQELFHTCADEGDNLIEHLNKFK
jgi:gag-polypeptide of LTR copia-type